METVILKIEDPVKQSAQIERNLNLLAVVFEISILPDAVVSLNCGIVPSMICADMKSVS